MSDSAQMRRKQSIRRRPSERQEKNTKVSLLSIDAETDQIQPRLSFRDEHERLPTASPISAGHALRTELDLSSLKKNDSAMPIILGAALDSDSSLTTDSDDSGIGFDETTLERLVEKAHKEKEIWPSPTQEAPRSDFFHKLRNMDRCKDTVRGTAFDPRYLEDVPSQIKPKIYKGSTETRVYQKREHAFAVTSMKWSLDRLQCAACGTMRDWSQGIKTTDKMKYLPKAGRPIPPEPAKSFPVPSSALAGSAKRRVHVREYGTTGIGSGFSTKAAFTLRSSTGALVIRSRPRSRGRESVTRQGSGLSDPDENGFVAPGDAEQSISTATTSVPITINEFVSTVSNREEEDSNKLPAEALDKNQWRCPRCLFLNSRSSAHIGYHDLAGFGNKEERKAAHERALAQSDERFDERQRRVNSSMSSALRSLMEDDGRVSSPIVASAITSPAGQSPAVESRSRSRSSLSSVSGGEPPQQKPMSHSRSDPYMKQKGLPAVEPTARSTYIRTCQRLRVVPLPLVVMEAKPFHPKHEYDGHVPIFSAHGSATHIPSKTEEEEVQEYRTKTRKKHKKKGWAGVRSSVKMARVMRSLMPSPKDETHQPKKVFGMVLGGDSSRPPPSSSGSKGIASSTTAALRHEEHNSFILPAIVKAMAQDNAKQIKLAHYNMGDRSAVAFASGLALMTYVSLDLQDNGIGSKGGRAIAEAIAKCPYVTRIDMSENRVGKPGALALAGLLAPRARPLPSTPLSSKVVAPPSLLATLLARPDTTPSPASASDGTSLPAVVASTPPRSARRSTTTSRRGSKGSLRTGSDTDGNSAKPSTRSIDKEDSPSATTKVAVQQQSALAEPGILALILGDNKLGDLAVLPLVHALKENDSVLHVSLRRNELGSGTHLGAGKDPSSGSGLGTALANMLSTNRTLVDLDLSWNCFRLSGATSILGSLQRNSALCRLHLQFNSLGAEGGVVLGVTLRHNTTLKYINLAHNNIPGRACVVLAAGLEENQTLSTLILDGNPIGTQGPRAIMRSMKTLQIKREISMVGCPMTIDEVGSVNLADPHGHYRLDLSDTYDRAVANLLLDKARQLVNVKQDGWQEHRMKVKTKKSHHDAPTKAVPTSAAERDVNNMFTAAAAAAAAGEKVKAADVVKVKEDHHARRHAAIRGATWPWAYELWPLSNVTLERRRRKKTPQPFGSGSSDNKVDISRRVKRPGWKLPSRGIMEFDYMQVFRRAVPTSTEAISEMGFAAVRQAVVRQQTADGDSSACILLAEMADELPLTANQARELTLVIRGGTDRAQAAASLFHCIVDTPNRFELLGVLSHTEIKVMQRILGDYIYVDLDNPNGYYRFDLARPFEHKMCSRILGATALENSMRRRLKLKDVSQNLNWSCIRNCRYYPLGGQHIPEDIQKSSERMAPRAKRGIDGQLRHRRKMLGKGIRIIWDKHMTLPRHGSIEFDYSSAERPPFNTEGVSWYRTLPLAAPVQRRRRRIQRAGRSIRSFTELIDMLEKLPHAEAKLLWLRCICPAFTFTMKQAARLATYVSSGPTLFKMGASADYEGPDVHGRLGHMYRRKVRSRKKLGKEAVASLAAIDVGTTSGGDQSDDDITDDEEEAAASANPMTGPNNKAGSPSMAFRATKSKSVRRKINLLSPQRTMSSSSIDTSAGGPPVGQAHEQSFYAWLHWSEFQLDTGRIPPSPASTAAGAVGAGGHDDDGWSTTRSDDTAVHSAKQLSADLLRRLYITQRPSTKGRAAVDFDDLRVICAGLLRLFDARKKKKLGPTAPVSTVVGSSVEMEDLLEILTNDMGFEEDTTREVLARLQIWTEQKSSGYGYPSARDLPTDAAPTTPARVLPGGKPRFFAPSPDLAPTARIPGRPHTLERDVDGESGDDVDSESVGSADTSIPASAVSSMQASDPKRRLTLLAGLGGSALTIASLLSAKKGRSAKHERVRHVLRSLCSAAVELERMRQQKDLELVRSAYRAEAMVCLLPRITVLGDFPRWVTTTSPAENLLLVKRLGWLFSFSPLLVERHYDLELQIPEDRVIAGMLVSLAVREPGENWDGETLDGVDWELPVSWIEEIPFQGDLSLEYLELYGKDDALRRKFFQTTLPGAPPVVQQHPPQPLPAIANCLMWSEFLLDYAKQTNTWYHAERARLRTQLEMNNLPVRFGLPPSNVDAKRLAAASADFEGVDDGDGHLSDSSDSSIADFFSDDDGDNDNDDSSWSGSGSGSDDDDADEGDDDDYS